VRAAELMTGSLARVVPLRAPIWSVAAHPHQPLVACGGGGGLFQLIELVGGAAGW
jgi:hypothetical protein